MFTVKRLVVLGCLGLSLGARSAAADPLGHYFAKDDHGLNLFDYQAYGDDPIDGGKPRKSKEESETDENPSRARQQEETKELQEYFTGRKVKDDCPTFPFCNHLPAPRPFLPQPHLLGKPNVQVIYPWQNANGNYDNQKERKVKASVEHAPHRQRISVGQVNDKREHWVHPYGRFGGSEGNEDAPAMEQYQRKMYGHLMGKIPVTNDIKYPGNLPDLSRTKESIAQAAHGAVNKASGHMQKDLGAGQLADAPPSSSEYIAAHKPGSNWDGRDPTTEHEKKDKDKEVKEKVEEHMAEINANKNPKAMKKVEKQLKDKVKEKASAVIKLGFTFPAKIYTGLLEKESADGSPCGIPCNMGPGSVLKALRKSYPNITQRINMTDIQKAAKAKDEETTQILPGTQANWDTNPLDFPFVFDADGKEKVGILEIQLLEKLIPLARQYKLQANYENLKEIILKQLNVVQEKPQKKPSCGTSCKSGPGKLLKAMRKRFPSVRKRVSLEEIDMSLKNMTIKFPFEFEKDEKNFVGRLEIQLLDKLIPLAQKHKLETNFKKMKQTILGQLKDVNTTVAEHGNATVAKDAPIGDSATGGSSTDSATGGSSTDSATGGPSTDIISEELDRLDKELKTHTVEEVQKIPVAEQSSSNETAESVDESVSKNSATKVAGKDSTNETAESADESVSKNSATKVAGKNSTNETAKNADESVGKSSTTKVAKTPSPSLTQSEKIAFRKALSTYDKNDDKKISFEEMVALNPEMGKGKVFRKVFLQHSGADHKLNAHEFWDLIKSSDREKADIGLDDEEDSPRFEPVKIAQPEIYNETHVLPNLRGNVDKPL
jgi:Ca2+-binding EF-hand superfamily protein